MRALAAAGQWSELASELAAVTPRTGENDYYYGLALAGLNRWSDAQKVLVDGERLAPRDARFPTELAGVAFKQKQNARAERLLRRSLRLAPSDAYANDFLATLYFLDGNTEAALKYWNRAAKPQIGDIRTDPAPRISAALLDHAFVFAPQSEMTVPEYLDTQTRLSGLGVFPRFQLSLAARDDGRFDASLRAQERDGMGGGAWEDLFLFLRGAPFLQVSPSYYNLRRDAINFDSMLRFDTQKRRAFAELSGPMEHGAKLRWELSADLRNENWAIRNGFAGPAPVLGSFNMRSAVGRADVAWSSSARFGWSVGGEVSHRDFRSVAPGTILTPAILASGYELKQQTTARAMLWRMPERRFATSASVESDAGRLLSGSQESFEKLTGSIEWHWLPQSRGDDYETSQTVSAGKIFGQAPLDELFILGLERDNNLPMRAHIGTRDGRKGSAPLGREYLLENWGLDKNIYSVGLATLKLGPFVDLGKINDAGTALGSHEWLLDVGAQVKLRMLGTGLVFSYGKDLRTGNNAFYLRLAE